MILGAAAVQILGGAAVHRCDNWPPSPPALAAEVTASVA